MSEHSFEQSNNEPTGESWRSLEGRELAEEDELNFIMHALANAQHPDKGVRKSAEWELGTLGVTVKKERNVPPLDPKQLEDADVSILEESKKEEGAKVFSKEAVFHLVLALAQREGILPEALELSKEYRNKDGDLVCMEIVVPEREAKRHGYGRIKYIYTLRGSHGKLGGVTRTVIVKVTSSPDDPYTYDRSDTVAECNIENNWHFLMKNKKNINLPEEGEEWKNN